jgi:KUP system potassium uptake protein
MIPGSWRLFGIILATIAAVIASQALITGSFTLVSEAIQLKFLPRMRIVFPSNQQGQIYIPSVNKMICVATIGIVLFFQTSGNMEADYGLSITISMIATTLMLFEWLREKGANMLWSGLFLVIFGVINVIFFLSCMSKFTRGGWVSLLIAGLIGAVMYVWYFGNKVRDKRGKQEFLRQPA